jgi:hypothetical protein
MKVKNLILSMLIIMSTSIVGMGQITKPTNITTTSLNTAVSIDFTKPIVADTVSITKYQWKVVGDSVWFDTITSVLNDSRITIPGLKTGTSYTVQIRAVDSIRLIYGRVSDEFQFTTTTLTEPILTSVERINLGLVVSFTPPQSNGGNGIQAYQYTVDGGFSWNTSIGATTTFTIGGLINGIEYTVGIRAVNTLGSGEHSNYIKGTPSTTASEPQLVLVTAYNTFVEVDFYPPASNGGASITTYQYSVDNGLTWIDRTIGTNQSPIVISGLKMNTTYQIRLRAINVAGIGISSTATETKTFKLNEPTNLSVVELDGELEISFDEPTVFTRSNVITYEYSVNDGNWVNGNTNTSPVLISELENGIEYTVKLRAVNSGGFGLVSESIVGVPFNETTVSRVQFINASVAGSVDIKLNGNSILSELEYKNASSYVDVWANRPITLEVVRNDETVLRWDGTLNIDNNYQFILQGDNINYPIGWKVVSDVRRISTIQNALQFRAHHTSVDLETVNLQRVSTSTPRSVEQLVAFNIQYGGSSNFQSYGNPSITTFQITKGETIYGQYLFDLGGTEGKVITFVFAGKVNSQSDRLVLIGFDGNGNSFVPVITTSNDDPTLTVPTEFVIRGNYPNPFNPTTVVKFDLPIDMNIRLEVVDLLGKLVLATNTQRFTSGENRAIQVDASKLSSGVYFYRLIGDGDTPMVRTSKFTLIK